MVSNSEATLKLTVPALLALFAATSVKPLWNGKPWRSSATRMPPTAVPPMRPTTVRSPPQITRLGFSAMLMPVGSRVVRNVRVELRVLPVSLVATARK